MGLLANVFPNGVLGIKGVRRERALTDQLVDSINVNDKDSLGALVDQAREPMTVAQHQTVRSAIEGKIENLQTAREVSGALDAHLQSLRENANEDEKNDLDGFAAQLKVANAFALNSNPALQQKGLEGLQQLAAAQTTWATNAEKSRIELQGLRDAPGLAGEKLRYDRDMDLSTKLSTAIKPVDDQLDALHVAQALNTDPKADNIQRALAFNNLIAALDPGGKRDPDGRYEGTNGLVNQLQNAYDRALGQKDQDAYKAVNEIIGTATGTLMQNRERTVSTFRRQATAYGGNADRVLSVVPEYAQPSVDRPSDEPLTTDHKDAPAKPPGPLEKAAAAVKAAAGAANANVPEVVKHAAVTSGILSAGMIAKLGWRAALAGLSVAPTAGVGALAIASGVANTQADSEALAKRPDESDAQYQQRVSEFFMNRVGGEPIDPGSIRVPQRNTDEYEP